MPLGELGVLLLVAVLAFLLAGALAPFETLGWWAGWYGRQEPDTTPPPQPAPAGKKAHYLVFLSGIHSVSGDTYAEREQAFLEALEHALPDAVIVPVFPYSVLNRPLTAQRLLAWFWRWALRMKLSKATLARLAGLVINLRNAWQTAISADRRFGPIYNQGTAELILEALLRAGYPVGSGVPITLIGYSGGGQIAVGAGSHLKAILRAPVCVISLGGVMSADPGLLELDGVYHIYGDHDSVQRLGSLFFPGRWPLLRYSAWNVAKDRGLVKLLPIGPMAHTGSHGYLDAHAQLPDGRSHQQATIDAIVGIVRGAYAAPQAGATPTQGEAQQSASRQPGGSAK